uniref:Uncharacterized protein n=1 Tax=Tetraodon nigroviridis TaxID=99883 RepID=H3C1U1_TETNG
AAGALACLRAEVIGLLGCCGEDDAKLEENPRSRWWEDRKEDQEKAGPSRHHGVDPHQVSRGCCCCRGPPAPGTRQVVHATHVEDLCLSC